MVSVLLLALLAAEFYLESPPIRTRAEAVALQDMAEADGHDAKVVRRYEHGVGWEFLVQVDGFGSAAEAEAAAVELAELSGRGITVYERASTGQSEPDERVTVEPGQADAEPELPSAEEVLARTGRALGGREGGLAALEAMCCIRFQYDRTLQEGDQTLSAHHDYVRAGELQALQIEPVGGPVVGSATVLTPESVQLWTSAGLIERDRDQASEILQGFAPAAVLRWPLTLPLRLDQPSYQQLVVVAVDEVDGASLVRLESPDGELQLWIDQATWHPTLLRSASDGGVAVQTFADWRELDTGLVVPFELQLERDGRVVEEIRVQQLEPLEPAEVDALAASWIAPDRVMHSAP